MLSNVLFAEGVKSKDERLSIIEFIDFLKSNNSRNHLRHDQLVLIVKMI